MKNYWTDRIRRREGNQLLQCLSQSGSWIINWEHFERFTLEWERREWEQIDPEFDFEKSPGDFLESGLQ